MGVDAERGLWPCCSHYITLWAQFPEFPSNSPG
jgi:hypothetical protein